MNKKETEVLMKSSLTTHACLFWLFFYSPHTVKFMTFTMFFFVCWSRMITFDFWHWIHFRPPKLKSMNQGIAKTAGNFFYYLHSILSTNGSDTLCLFLDLCFVWEINFYLFIFKIVVQNHTQNLCLMQWYLTNET